MPSLSKRFLMASVRSNINQVFKCCTHFIQIIGVADPNYPVDPVENSACNTGGFDKITNFVGPKQNDQYT